MIRIEFDFADLAAAARRSGGKITDTAITPEGVIVCDQHYLPRVATTVRAALSRTEEGTLRIEILRFADNGLGEGVLSVLDRAASVVGLDAASLLAKASEGLLIRDSAFRMHLDWRKTTELLRLPGARLVEVAPGAGRVALGIELD